MEHKEERKTVQLSGQAAKDYLGGSKKRRSTKKKQEGGVQGLEPPTGVALHAAPVSASSMLTTWRTPTPPAIHVVPSRPMQTGGQQKQEQKQEKEHQEAGTRQIKVELKKKHTAKKVQLQPKKTEAPKAAKSRTRKARRVLLGVKSLHKRMTHAKKMHKTVSEMPLDKLKEELVKKKLIKPTSKAPESVLRQIASDAQIVSKNAL
jgi:hypothetical protein